MYLMKWETVLSTLLVFQLNFSFTLAEVFQIHRTRPQARSGWQNGIDYFRVSSPLCGTSDYECSVFSALGGAQSCNCTCPGKKSTFTKFENQWSCIENSDVRGYLQSRQYGKPGEKACEQDMETLFVNEFSNTSLRVLEAGDEKAISIRNTWSSCELDRNHSWYFGCSDSRLSFPFKFYLETMMNLFTLAKGDFYLNLKVNSNVRNAHLLRGRIINLGIYCRNTSTVQTQRGCLLFKLGGNMTCPITNTGSPGLATSTPQSELSTHPASFTERVKTGTKPIHPSVSPTLNLSSSFVASPSISSVAQPNVSSHVPSSRPSSRPNSGPKSDGSEQSSREVTSVSVWLVSGLIVSSFFIVIIVGFLIIRCNHSRRKSKTVILTRRQETQDPTLMNQHTNAAFQTDEHHGYFTLNSREPAVYASMYQVPMIDRRTSLNEISNPLEQDPNTGHIYDVLDFPQEHSIYGAKNSTELPALPPKNPAVDNATKFQNYGQISIEQLVYNIVEEILASGYERPAGDGSKKTEPVYNVSEPEPQRDTSQYEEVIVEKEELRQGNSEGLNRHDEVTVKELEPSTDASGEPSQYEEVNVKKSEPFRVTPEKPIQNDDVTANGPVYSTLEEPKTNSFSASDL